jgi:hypothetical protein
VAQHRAVVEHDGRVAQRGDRRVALLRERPRPGERTLHVRMMRPALVLCGVFAIALAACQEPPATEPVARGRQVYRQLGCEQCHRIDGSGGVIGPDLSHIATVAATRRPGTPAEDYIAESIDSPGAYIVPGFNDVMPRGLARGLSAFDRDSLIRFLMTRE